MLTDVPKDVPHLLRLLMADDAGRPRLTWYGPDHERIELSAKTLNNWVSKSANLLADELGAEPHTRIGLSMPPHWRTVVWMLAIWSAGAHAVVIPPAAEVEALITERPDSGVSQVSAHAGAQLIAVALPALATRFTGTLPDGAIDAATEVRLQPDHFEAPEPPADDDPALTVRGQDVNYGDLLKAERLEPFEPGTRLLTGAGPDRALSAYLAPLLAGGSIVLHAGRDASDVQRIAAQEGITRELV